MLKKFFCWLLILVIYSENGKCFSLTENTNITKRFESKIVGGHDATHVGTKHLVSIRLKSLDWPFGSGHICGGSLINLTTVLTAAHCFLTSNNEQMRRASEYTVVIGTLDRTNRTNETFQSNVARIIPHEKFNLDTLQNDIGLMVLEKPTPMHYKTIEPIKLTNHKPKTGTNCKIDGWGKLYESSDSIPKNLQTVNINILDFKKCKQNYVPMKLKDGMFCAGSWSGGKDSCQGDSGGPLTCDNELVGVVSWGHSCASSRYPGIYSDVNYYSNWIRTGNANKIHMKFYFVYTFIFFNFFVTILLNNIH